MQRILIVEDSPTMRALLVSALEALDRPVKITEVASGFEALRELPRVAYDLILTDINMPDINGLELVSFVKNNAAFRSIPLVIVSTEGSERDRDKGLRLGADAYLVKPFAPETLQQIAHDLLDRSGRAARCDVAQRSRKGRRGSKTDQEFVSEAEEILDRMRQDLADLNEERVAGDDVDPDVVNRLFRSAHSLKGLAGLFGFDPIQDLAHRVEDILDGLRLGRVRLELSVVALIDESVHLFASLLEQIGNPDALAAAIEPIGQLAERIQAAREAPVATRSSVSSRSIPRCCAR